MEIMITQVISSQCLPRFDSVQ
uniref:Uncharacterized protein n=1 Tax=Anguilla anguilla TaxID=7936 RepID=A0A0E9PB38_ANGAN